MTIEILRGIENVLRQTILNEEDINIQSILIGLHENTYIATDEIRALSGLCTQKELAKAVKHLASLCEETMETE